MTKQKKKAEARKSSKEVLIDKAKKKGIYKQRTRRPRPETILVKPAVSQTYADTLWNSVKPEEVGMEIKTVCQTRNGDIIFELGADSKEGGKFKEELKSILGDDTESKLDIKDLDCCTTVEEVTSAIREAQKI